MDFFLDGLRRALMAIGLHLRCQHNTPRIRPDVLIARGRDAADVPITHSCGQTCCGLSVVTDEWNDDPLP